MTEDRKVITSPTITFSYGNAISSGFMTAEEVRALLYLPATLVPLMVVMQRD